MKLYAFQNLKTFPLISKLSKETIKITTTTNTKSRDSRHTEREMTLTYEEVLDHIVNNQPVPMEEVPDIVLEEPTNSETVEMKLKPWQTHNTELEKNVAIDPNAQMKDDMEQELKRARKEGLHD